MPTSRRHSTGPYALRFLSRITGGRRRKPAGRQHRTARSGGQGARRGLSYGRWNGQRERGSWLWQRLQGPLRLAVALAVLGLLNVYVLYWKRGTSVPALWDLANAGRRASLGARLQGPVGTPPVPITKSKKLHTPPLPDYPRVMDIALQEGASMHAVLLRAGQSGRTLSELDAALQSLLDPGGVGIGQTLTLYYDAEERLSTVDYRLNAGLSYHLERVQTGGAERFVSVRQAEPLTIQEVAVQATLERLKAERQRPLVPSILLRSVSTNPSGSLGIGSFGGGFHLKGWKDPVLVSSIDGVGTKLEGSTKSLVGRCSVTKRYISSFDTGLTPGFTAPPIHIVMVFSSAGRGSTAGL